MRTIAKGSTRDEILGRDKISRLIMKLSLPAMAGMIVTALYNVVDTIFIGQGAGPLAIGGLAISFPFQMLVMAFAMTAGIGTASIVSRNLGSGNRERAYRATGNAITVALVFGLLIMIGGMIFLDPIIRLFGATESILPYARQYLSIILFGSVPVSFSMAANNLIRAEGRATIAMLVMIIGAGMNIILDPIFIFGFKMGIGGAALATVISQYLSFFFILIFYISGRSSLRITPLHLIPNMAILKEVFSLGLPALARQGAASVVIIIINNSLRIYGNDFAIAAFALVNRVLHFGIMPIFGIAQGFQPICGYNYGAKNMARVRESIVKSATMSTVIAVFFFLLLTIFPKIILSIFTQNTTLIEFGVRATRIIVLNIPLVGLQIIGATFFQAIGRALPSLLLSLSRQVILLLPLLIFLPLFMGLSGIWTAFPIADFLATVITTVWLLREMKKIGIRFPALRAESLT